MCAISEWEGVGFGGSEGAENGGWGKDAADVVDECSVSRVIGNGGGDGRAFLLQGSRVLQQRLCRLFG